MNNLKQIFRAFEIKDRYELMVRKNLYSNFIDRPLSQQVSPIVNESVELKEAILKGDINEIKKEYQDCLYGMLLLTSWLIKEWILTEEDFRTMWKQQKEKIVARSPFLKTHEKVDIETEERIRYATKWQKVKPIA